VHVTWTLDVFREVPLPCDRGDGARSAAIRAAGCLSQWCASPEHSPLLLRGV